MWWLNDTDDNVLILRYSRNCCDFIEHTVVKTSVRTKMLWFYVTDEVVVAFEYKRSCRFLEQKLFNFKVQSRLLRLYYRDEVVALRYIINGKVVASWYRSGYGFTIQSKLSWHYGIVKVVVVTSRQSKLLWLYGTVKIVLTLWYSEMCFDFMVQ